MKIKINMREFILLVFLILINIQNIGCQEKSKISITPEEINLGDVYEKCIYIKNYKIKNLSNEYVRFKSVKSTCGCITSDIPKSLRPEEELILSVTAETMSLGPFFHKITFLPENQDKEIYITLKGVSVPWFILEPFKLDFDCNKKSFDASYTFSILKHKTTESLPMLVSVNNKRTDIGKVTYKILKNSDHIEKYTFIYHLHEHTLKKNFEFDFIYLLFSDNNHVYKEITIPITFSYKDEIMFDPSSIFMGLVDPLSESQREFKCIISDPNVSLLKVEIMGNKNEWSCNKTNEKENDYQNIIDFIMIYRSDKTKGGVRSCQVKLFFNNGLERIVPITAIVKP